MNLKIGDKNITIRKWKGRDKKNFLQHLRDDSHPRELLNSLVYDNIVPSVPLSPDEFKFVLSRIRAISLGEEFTAEFYCGECGEVFEQEFLLRDAIRHTEPTPVRELRAGNTVIQLGEIRNKDFYIDRIQENADYDFLLRIASINGNDGFTLEELEALIDDLDIDVLTNILEQWEAARFTVDDVNDVQCECGETQTYQFDEIPGFLPESWFGED